MASYSVLITALGGDIAQGVLKALRLFAPTSRVVGTDKWPSSAGLFMIQKAFVIRPAAGENPYSFVRRIAKICQTDKIQIAFICHEAEQAAVAKYRTYLARHTRTYFVVQPLKILRRCSDKLATYNWLERRGIRVPDTSSNPADLGRFVKQHGFPLVIKPREGSGSRDFHLVKDRATFKKIWSEVPSPLFQEYINNSKDEEYTVGIFLDNNSHSLGAIPMLRQLRFGLTWYGFVDAYPDIAATAVAAAEAVQAVGPCNVQLRRDSQQQPCVIEINARFSSTVAFRAHLGFNEVGAAIDYFINQRLPRLTYRPGLVMKAWDELIVPLKQYQQLERTNTIINKLSHAPKKSGFPLV